LLVEVLLTVGLALDGMLSQLDHIPFKLAVRLVLSVRTNEFDLGDFAKGVTEPGIGFQSVSHVVLKPLSLDVLPEIPERISSPLWQSLLTLNLHPELGTFGLSFVLKGDLEHFDGLGDGVPDIRFPEAEPFAFLVLVFV
jgi:hypothetical protein